MASPAWRPIMAAPYSVRRRADGTRSVPLITVHRERAIGRAGVDAASLRAASCGAQRGEERQEMLLARMIARGVGGAPAVIDEVLGAALGDRPCEPIGKVADPGRRRRIDRRHAQLAEIVRRAAGTEDQHALVAQRLQRRADAELVRGAETALHRELRDRTVGLGIHQHQWHPGAMIEAVRLAPGGYAGTLE